MKNFHYLSNKSRPFQSDVLIFSRMLDSLAEWLHSNILNTYRKSLLLLLSSEKGGCSYKPKYLAQTVSSQVALVIKNPLSNAGDIRDTDLIPGLGRSLGGGNGTLLQYSCLENPMDRGTWHEVTRVGHD